MKSAVCDYSRILLIVITARKFLKHKPNEPAMLKRYSRQMLTVIHPDPPAKLHTLIRASAACQYMLLSIGSASGQTNAQIRLRKYTG